MLKLLFMTNMASPYVIDYLNELGKRFDITALIEVRSAKHRKQKWFKYDNSNFNLVFLDALQITSGTGFSLKVIPYLSRKKYDRIIIANPTTSTGIIALLYCRWFHVPFCIQSEGGFQGNGKGFKEKFKKYIMEKAELFLTGMGGDNDYFLSYGATYEKLRPYPFTSLYCSELEKEPVSKKLRRELRDELGLPDGIIILSVGRPIHVKGFDLLIKASAVFSGKADTYIVGGVPSAEYSEYLQKENVTNLHFVDFLPPEAVKKYYMAADIFVLPTRGDTWGLVINEAMANGLPVVTTDRCIAGLELIENGVNGFIVQTDNLDELQNALLKLIDNENLRDDMAKNNLKKISDYTIENMSEVIGNHLTKGKA